MNPRKKPEFKRWMSQTYKRVKPSWRKPRGRQSKIRAKLKGKLKMPTVGYRVPKKLRYLHPSGFKEVLVHNINDLLKVDPKKEIVRISGKVGKKKRSEIVREAEKCGIKVLNP